MLAAIVGAFAVLLGNVLPYPGEATPLPTCDPAVKAAMRARFHGQIDCSENLPDASGPWVGTVIINPTPTPTPTP